jgi:hypothetical protein
MADRSFENKQKFKKVYKSSTSLLFFLKDPLKFNNKLFILFYFISTQARMARMFIKNKIQ